MAIGPRMSFAEYGKSDQIPDSFHLWHNTIRSTRRAQFSRMWSRVCNVVFRRLCDLIYTFIVCFPVLYQSLNFFRNRISIKSGSLYRWRLLLTLQAYCKSQELISQQAQRARGKWCICRYLIVGPWSTCLRSYLSIVKHCPAIDALCAWLLPTFSNL